MNILVTGSNGFIGSKLVLYLKEKGNFVYGLSRTENKEKLSDFDLNMDITDINLIEYIKSKISLCDAIIHNAAKISYDDSDVALSDVNCVGTHQIVNLAKELKVKKFVYISSLPIIGSPNVLPITEEHPLNPSTTYHSSKLYGENISNSLIKFDTSTISFRLTSPIGIGMPNNKIFSVFVKNSIDNIDLNLTGSGNRVQNYIDVRDICRAVNISLENKSFSGVLNLGGDKGISDLELAKLCISATNSKSKIIYKNKNIEEEEKWIVSIEKAKQILGFKPKYSLTDSIKSLGDYYKNSNNK